MWYDALKFRMSYGLSRLYHGRDMGRPHKIAPTASPFGGQLTAVRILVVMPRQN
jgi:hypothetical protein